LALSSSGPLFATGSQRKSTAEQEVRQVGIGLRGLRHPLLGESRRIHGWQLRGFRPSGARWASRAVTVVS
jgi:hypothetical protein